MAIEENEFLKNLKSPDSDEIWELVAEGDWLVGQKFKISGKAVLGREAGCDITIPGTHLSRRHAELEIKGSRLKIRDLGSSNGTYVNDKRVMESDLKPGDTVRFDVLRFRVKGPDAEELDNNATIIRQVPKNMPRPKPAQPAQPKNWKTKPTSVGNREETGQIPTVSDSGSSIWTIAAVVVGVITVAGIAYMITQL